MPSHPLNSTRDPRGTYYNEKMDRVSYGDSKYSLLEIAADRYIHYLEDRFLTHATTPQKEKNMGFFDDPLEKLQESMEVRQRAARRAEIRLPIARESFKLQVGLSLMAWALVIASVLLAVEVSAWWSVAVGVTFAVALVGTIASAIYYDGTYSDDRLSVDTTRMEYQAALAKLNDYRRRQELKDHPPIGTGTPPEDAVTKGYVQSQIFGVEVEPIDDLIVRIIAVERSIRSTDSIISDFGTRIKKLESKGGLLA